MKLTILGSCRQDSLHSYFDVTNIKNGLTFPHYSKEIVQTIEFCKQISTMPKHLTRFMFRSGMLDRREIDPNEFADQYNSTDIFVIEIASRIQYEYKGFYAHHIITEPGYHFPDRSNILERNATDEEIEYDILRIRELLAGKPFIIVSHICTRREGKRYELVELLTRICTKYTIPLFVPHEQLANEDPDMLYQKEHLLSHYTPLGHECVGKYYKTFIDTVLKNTPIQKEIEQGNP
jgi:hypothetical protein